MKKAALWARWIALTPIRFVHEFYQGVRDGFKPGGPLPHGRLKPDWLHRSPND